MTNGVFSDYELREQAVKFAGENSQWMTTSCVGSCEEELEAISITKKCRGKVIKSRTKGTGNGTLKYSMHIPWEFFIKAYGMEFDSLKEGIYAYGSNNAHREFSIVQHIFDEDEAEKFVAYPRCIIQTGRATKIENGAEEVAESELEVALMPDDLGMCKYEALAEELDAATKNAWMTAWTPELMQKTAS